MVAQSTSIAYDSIRSLNSATLSGSYLPIGTPLTYAARLLKIVNSSGVAVTISTDGSTDMDIVPSNGFALYDLGTNKGASASELTFPSGTQFYAKGSASTGLIYLVCLYGSGTANVSTGTL